MKHIASKLGNRRKKNICGGQIRAIRQKQGKTLVDFAAELEIDFGIKMDRSVLGKIENGARQLTDIELLAIAAVLQVELEALLPIDKRRLLSEVLKAKAEKDA